MFLQVKQTLKSYFCDALEQIDGLNCKVRFWDGSAYEFGRGDDFIVHFKNKNSLRKVIFDLPLGFGEGYMNGDIEVEGDLMQVVRVGIQFEQEQKGKKVSWLQSFNRHFLQRNNRWSDRKNISFHYDLGNDFYRLWLDLKMIYSCGYFRNEKDSLEKAQEQKIDLCCRKLKLQPDESLLDIGCGWGGLLVHAAKRYGVQGVGITLSKEQVEYGKQQIKKEGLCDRVHLKFMDYRDLPIINQTFDKIVSVGMFEHVGKANMRLFMECARKVLKSDGLLLLHTIGKMVDEPPNSWIRKYIFPGSYCPDLGSILQNASSLGLNFIDCENMRIHYSKTLDNWRERFEQNEARIRSMFDDRFIRMWRLYLAGCSAQFWFGTIHLFQLLFSDGVRNDLPLTREWMLMDSSMCSLQPAENFSGEQVYDSR